MKVSHEEQQSLPVEVIDDIICNRCGGSCKLDGSCYDDRPRVEPDFPNRVVRNASGFGGMVEVSVDIRIPSSVVREAVTVYVLAGL